MQGIGVVLPVENKMKTREAFGGWFGVIDLAMTIAMVLYAAVGFYGYLRFGDAVQGSITLNLPCHQAWVVFKGYSFSWKAQLKAEHHVPYGGHTVLFATWHGWICPSSTPARQAGTWFTFPGGIEGWDDLGVGYILRWFTCPQSSIQVVTTWWWPDRESNLFASLQLSK